MPFYQTKCGGCNEVLTKGNVRLRSANFDSAMNKLYPRTNTKFITYAWCDNCYEERKQWRMTVAKAKKVTKKSTAEIRISKPEKYDSQTILQSSNVDLDRLNELFGISDEQDIQDIIDGDLAFDGY